MIKLKNEINKSATMRELRKVTEKGYEHSWQPELQVEAFVKGAEAVLNLLHFPGVNYCNCSFAMVMRDFNTGEPYCAECGKLIE